MEEEGVRLSRSSPHLVEVFEDFVGFEVDEVLPVEFFQRFCSKKNNIANGDSI